MYCDEHKNCMTRNLILKHNDFGTHGTHLNKVSEFSNNSLSINNHVILSRELFINGIYPGKSPILGRLFIQ